MPTCPPPPAAAPSRLLKGKTGPNYLFMMSGAQACCHAGGCAASLQGQSTTSIRRLPLAASQQSKVMEFTQHFAWAVDRSVASNSRAKGEVAVGLDAAAQAFRLLPVAEADRWNLEALAEMNDGEKAWPHVKKCQVVGPAATGAQCPAFMARLHPHATPHLVSPQVRHTPDCRHPDCVAAMATAEYSGARAMLYSKKGGAPAKRRGRAPRASGATCPWIGYGLRVCVSWQETASIIFSWVRTNKSRFHSQFHPPRTMKHLNSEIPLGAVGETQCAVPLKTV